MAAAVAHLLHGVIASTNPSLRSSSPFSSGVVRRNRSSHKVRNGGFRAEAVVFRDLDTDYFRHPLDKQNTVILRAIPDLNELGKALLGTISEKIMLLDNIGIFLLVSEIQAILAHELGHLNCDHGIWLTFANILTLGAYPIPERISLFIDTYKQSLEEQLFRWFRAAELTCDPAALLVSQNPKVVVSVLMKLAGGSPSLVDQLNVDALLDQARSYEKASSSRVEWHLLYL